MIAEIIRFISFLLPIPFMVLFFIKTNKLNFLKKYSILTLLIPIFANLLFPDLGYNLYLIIFYIILVLFGATYFNSKYSYSQSLSISFCLVYFASFLWEVPILLYTIFMHGGIDGAFPLHVIYIFPMLLIYEKIKINLPKNLILSLFGWVFFTSTLCLSVLTLNNINIWNPLLNTPTNQIFTQFFWMLNRIIVILILFLLYSNSSLRRIKYE